jgi:phosphopantothenoylcysteine decarboxylase/phosphopantothenate--cysteine ligase
MLNGKKLIVGITGSIAAYKSALLVRELVRAGAEVKVIMTHAAKDFITPLTLSTLSKNPVLYQFNDNADSGEWNNHVELGLWADALIIAPLSANTMAKMCSGVCDNLLMATYLSAKCVTFVAPAMDLDMYKHGTTGENIDKLKSLGVQVISPTSGELASGLSGKGRMEEPENIKAFLDSYYRRDLPLTGKKALVSAGPTYEDVDPVRFIGNRSSGKMGFAIAEELANQGAEVTLVAGPVHLSLSNTSINRVDVRTAKEMKESCLNHNGEADIIIMAAAVADYTPAEVAEQKIKKKDEDWSIPLVRTTDILAKMGELKKKDQLLVGFALETNNEASNAQGKLERKNLDFIVLNSLRDAGAGFAHDTNKITIIDRDNNHDDYKLKSKPEVAADVVQKVIEMMNR